MSPLGFPPRFPPSPLDLLRGEEIEEVDPPVPITFEGFRSRLAREGYDENLIEMGIKVAQNHMRPPEEAFRIGENYIREMAK